MRYWLIKSEPETFSIDDLEQVGREPWDGVRNYQARNFMKNDMEVGDLALFYHSNTKPPGVAGVAKVVSEPYPDVTQFDSHSKYYDAKSKEENPRWSLVDFEFVAKLKEYIPLVSLKEEDALKELLILRKGNRLSITPIEEEHFKKIVEMGGLIEAEAGL